MFTHNISPEFFTLGPVSVRWYGLCFVAGLILAYLVLRSLFKKRKWKIELLESVAVYLFFGMVIGARLGHILFYNPKYFFGHPLEILKIWEGGLASHGAAIGVLVAYLIWIKVRKVKFSKFADTLVVAFPLVAGFVRLGNFFNSEIVGTRTNLGIGVVFERLGEDFARHPVQLYSALMNWLVFVVLFLVYKKYYKKTPPLFFLFFYMGLYFAGRFAVEFWKDLHEMPDWSPLSMGQVLSVVPILIAAIYFVFVFPRQRRRRKC